MIHGTSKKNWDTIDVKLNYKNSTGQEGATIWTIKLDQMNGTAWWNPPPDVNIVSVFYSVNDGLQQVLDFRRESNPVVNAKEGDSITITEVWYKADKNINNQSMLIGASIKDDKQEIENKTSDKVVIREGIHPFENFKPMTWIISPGIKWLGLIAIRSDDTVLDSYAIELSDTKKAGLVSTQKSVVWPFDQVEYLDFEKNDTELWEVKEADSISISANEVFSGSYSLAITTKSGESQLYVRRLKPFRSDLVIGHVFWPEQDGIKVEWAQMCVSGTDYCASIWQGKHRWNTFVMDFSHLKDENGEFLSSIDMSALYLQGWIAGVSPDKPYTFYMDGIEIYPSRTP